MINATAPQADGSTASTLLRYDSVNNAWQSFGALGANHSGTGYYLLVAGPNRTVQAEFMHSFFDSYIGHAEIYNGDSLQLLQTLVSPPAALIPQSVFEPHAAASDAAGNIYRLDEAGPGNSIDGLITKRAPDGTLLAVLDPTLLYQTRSSVYSRDDLQVGTDGQIYVSSSDGFLVVDQGLTQLKAVVLSSAGYGSGAGRNLTIALVKP